MKTIIEHETVIELLEIDVKFAFKSNCRPLVYQAAGAIDMAWNLGVITVEEYNAFRKSLTEWFSRESMV